MNNTKKILLLLIFIILGACFKEPQIVVKLEDIQIREDNLIYYNDELFTGMVGRSDNGFYDVEFGVKNGKLDGYYKHWLLDELYSNYSYKEGKLEGKSKEYWHFFKTIKREIDIKDGIGTMNEYYPDGELMGEGSFVNSKLEGERREYYKSGSIKEILNYKEGKLHGEHKTYYEDGRKRFIGQYKNGILLECEGWFGNGQVAVRKKDKVVKFYNSLGELYRVNDLNKMKQYFYYPDGSLKEEKVYVRSRISLWPAYSHSKIYYYNQLGQETLQEFIDYEISLEDINTGNRLTRETYKERLKWERYSKMQFNMYYNVYDELGLAINIVTGGIMSGNVYAVYDENGIIKEVYVPPYTNNVGINVSFEKVNLEKYRYMRVKSDERWNLIKLGALTEDRKSFEKHHSSNRDREFNERNYMTKETAYDSPIRVDEYIYDGSLLINKKEKWSGKVVHEYNYEYDVNGYLTKKIHIRNYYNSNGELLSTEKEIIREGINIVENGLLVRQEYREKYTENRTPNYYISYEYDKKNRMIYRKKESQGKAVNTDRIGLSEEFIYDYYEIGDDEIFSESLDLIPHINRLLNVGIERKDELINLR